MVYVVRIKTFAAKELAAIDGNARRQRIVDSIAALANSPRPDGCKSLQDSKKYIVFESVTIGWFIRLTTDW